MSQEIVKILVVCTGNSCRSVMAESLINALGKGRLLAYSAGSQPVGYVHPQALETLCRHNIDPGTPRSQSWDDFVDEKFDYVITVCDSAAAETCPAFPGNYRRLHWSTPDPAKATGSDKDISEAFEQVYKQLEGRIQQEFLSHR